MALLDQALDDGAGHVAAADECDVTAHGAPGIAMVRVKLSPGSEALAVI
jgi:hypothetical protein